MRFIGKLFILVACVVCSALAQDDERPAAPARGLLKRGSLAKGKATTTTTTPAPQPMHQRFAKDVAVCPTSSRRVGRVSDDRVTFAYDLCETSLSFEEFLPASLGHHPSAELEEAEYEDEGEFSEEGEPQEASTEAPSSTTEGKKLVGSGVRPFRSNTELLEILKRKRAQAAEAKLHAPSTTTSSPAQDSLDPTKITYNNKSKKRFNNSPVTREVANDEAPAPPKPSRGRFGRPATRSVQEEEEPQVDAAPKVVSGRTFRRGGN
ncbi:hypothetical protein HW555_008516 [Spodoptera exigua]|uniref:Uncharacterized protein n=1 Tax=Spodoptera exigua TaxID=7107 RepID=A0A835GAX9_SPOEX|nr:hypothetical protein HW555_008516 [Spodoptera exigua]